jgi:hypothetical protein
MGVCLIAGAVAKTLQVTAFTLAWTHSVQKTDWQEDWRVTADGLTLVEARIKSSGAGVDPPADARLIDGWWRWRAAAAPRKDVILAHSGAAGDWRICITGQCRTLPDIFGRPLAAEPIVMTACAPPEIAK